MKFLALVLLSIQAAIDRVFGFPLILGLGADIAITAGNVLASSLVTREKRYTAGGTLTAGQYVYLNDSEQWVAYDANGTAGHEATRKRGLTEHGAALNQPVSVALKDPEFTLGGTVTAGTVVNASAANPGGVTHDVPASGSYTSVIGVPINGSTTKINLNPVHGGIV